METEFFDNFHIKPYKYNYVVPLWLDCVLWKSKKIMFNFLPKYNNFQNVLLLDKERNMALKPAIG